MTNAKPLSPEQMAEVRAIAADPQMLTIGIHGELLLGMLATVDALTVDRARFRDAAADEDVRVAKIRAAANDERNAQERENAELRIALRVARAEIDRLRAFQEAVIANAKNFT